MLQRFTMALIQAGFSIVGYPAVFSVRFGSNEGLLKSTIQNDGAVSVEMEGAPHSESFAGKDLMELFAEMEGFGGHEIKPRTGNKYRVNDQNDELAGEFIIAPERGGTKIVLQACSASANYRQVCETAEIPVEDFSPEEIEECLSDAGIPRNSRSYGPSCCW